MLGSATRRSLARAGHEDIQSNSHNCTTRASRLGSTYSKPASPVSTPSASAVQGAAHGSSRRGSARCRTHKQRTNSTTVDFSGTAASICSSWSSREVHAASGSAYRWRNTTSTSSNSRAPGHGRPAASSLHLTSAAEDMQDAGLLDGSSLHCQATPMAVLAGTTSSDRSTSIYTHDSSSPRLSSSSHKLGSNHSSSRWTFEDEELDDSSSTSETSCLTNAPQCTVPDPRILLAQQLQHINLPADQFSEELSSVLQQAVLIAAAAAAAGDKQRFTSSPSPHMQQHSAAAVPNAQDSSSTTSSSSSSPINASQLAVVVSEQHLLLALLHHSTTALKHVLNHTAAVPNALAAAQNTVVRRVAAAAAAATQYVNFDAATDWQQQQQQQRQGTMQQSFSLALTPGVLHVLSMARNAGRQTGGVACVPHLLHAISDLPAAAKLFQVALGAAVITADLKEQMEQDIHQYAVHATGSGGSSSSNSGCVCGSGPDITCVCEHDGSKSWINGSELHGSSSSRQQSSSVHMISRTDVNSGSSSSSRRGSSNASPLLSRLGWIDTTLDSILTAAEQKDATTAVATLTDTISRLAQQQQQQQHRPEQQWLAAAWSIIKQRLTTYLSLNCYVHQNNSVTDRFSLHNSVTHVSDNDNVTDDIRDSIEDSIIAAAHAEAVSLLTGVAAAAAVSLRIWDHQTSDIQVTLDLVMSHLDQIDGSDSWQMNGCNISDLYLPIMVQMLPLTAPGSPWQQQQHQLQQQQQHDSAAVCNAAADRAKQHSVVYNNFIRCINRLQPHGISVMLHNSCSPQAVADALLLMLQQERTNPPAAADRVDSSSSSSSSSIAGGLQPTVCVAFMHSLTSALKNSGHSSSSSSSSSTTTSTGSRRGKHCRSSSSSSKQQQQCILPETLVHLLAACQSAPQQFTAQPDVTNAATELTAAAWLHMAAAADRYTSEQLVHVLRYVRKNKYFLRYTAVAGAADHNNDASKALITGTKHILHRLCTKQTLKPEEAAAALAVLDTPLWPASMSQAAQSPLIQGLLNRVTDSIQDMSATQLEQLLSVAIRLPWCGLGRRLSEEWMFRVLEALVRVTTDVANKELDAATASTLAAALGDLCDLPVAASEQQMFELQEALPLLLPKLDERHTSMVLAFVSRQAHMNTNAAVVFV